MSTHIVSDWCCLVNPSASLASSGTSVNLAIVYQRLHLIPILFLIDIVLFSPLPAFSVCGFPDFHLNSSAFDNAINKGCINFRIERSYASQFCSDCVIVKSWEPRYAVTTVISSGDRRPSVDLFMQALDVQATQLLLGTIGSPSCTHGADGGAYTFNTSNARYLQLRQAHERDGQAQIATYRASLSAERVASLREQVRSGVTRAEAIPHFAVQARAQVELNERLREQAGVLSLADWLHQEEEASNG